MKREDMGEREERTKQEKKYEVGWRDGARMRGRE